MCIAGEKFRTLWCQSFFLDDVGSCIYPQTALDLGPVCPFLTQPRQESAMGKRTLFRTASSVFPARELLREWMPGWE